MIRRLQEMQPNFALKQTQLREAIAVLNERHPDWRLDEKQTAEMQDIVSQRVLTMTRQVANNGQMTKESTLAQAIVET